MESRIYSVLFQFNYGIEQALAALDTLEKMDLEPPEYVQQVRVRFQEVAANANSHFTDRVRQERSLIMSAAESSTNRFVSKTERFGQWANGESKSA